MVTMMGYLIKAITNVNITQQSSMSLFVILQYKAMGQ